MLVEFINQEDPLLAMLEWLVHQLMQMEAESKVETVKGKHSPERRTLLKEIYFEKRRCFQRRA